MTSSPPPTASCTTNDSTDGVYAGTLTITNSSGVYPDLLGFTLSPENGSEPVLGVHLDTESVCTSLLGGTAPLYPHVTDGTWGPFPAEIVVPDMFGPNGGETVPQTVRVFSPKANLQGGTNTTTTDGVGGTDVLMELPS